MKITMELLGRTYEILTPIITTQKIGRIDIDIPLFKLNAVASLDDDVENAVSEVVHCFCVDSNKNGKGVEQELKSLGIIC